MNGRLFSHITMNWRGRPLTSHEVILESIAATTTRTGLRVKAQLDTHTYPTGIGVGDAEMAALPLTRHTFQGEWNYALHPQPIPAIPAARSSRPPAPQWDPAMLSDPALTGLTPHQLQHLIETLAAKPEGGGDLVRRDRDQARHLVQQFQGRARRTHRTRRGMDVAALQVPLFGEDGTSS